jgi:AraC-like DNA-binding protein
VPSAPHGQLAIISDNEPVDGRRSSAMIYREVAPHPKLRNHVKCLWVLDHDYGNSPHDHEHLWADAHTELIFTSGRRYSRKVRGRTVALPASFVVGPFQNELQLFCKGRVSLVAARFWPWGFHCLSRVPMSDLKNSVRSCRLALGHACESLERTMAGVQNLDARLATLDEALLNLLGSVPKPKPLARPMAMEILEARGVTPISELLENHDIQARRLERIFLKELGVTAKIFCRIVRFNHAKAMIERDPELDIGKLAHDCGYADQSHFTRNFREMFGITPADFKTRMKGAAELLRGEKRDVVFLQDAAAEPS